jgi:hypothetical protein
MMDDIELHDSSVRLSMTDGTLILHFCPGQIHHWEKTEAGWVGEGRNQDIDMVVGEASLEPPPTEGEILLSGGEITIGEELFDNMIPVPMERSAAVRGRLESVYGDVVRFAGQGLSARFVGPWEFVEKLPADWAPREDAAEQGVAPLVGSASKKNGD